MITIGLLGGVASGKSTVARLLAELGAVVLDADRAAHDVLASDDVKRALVEHWGDSMLDAQGTVDRQAVAKQVFGESIEATENRRLLEGLVHPGVRKRLRDELANLAQQGAKVAVLDIPLLLESDYRGDCDLLLFIDTPDSVRAGWAADRGWSTDEFRWREAAQAPIPQKRAAATDTLVNDGSPDSLRSSVERFWSQSVVPRL